MRKKTIIYFALSAVLVLLVYLAITNQKSSTIENDFLIVDTNTITTIFMADLQGNTVNLEKKDGEWYANDEYKAVDGYIDVLLNTFSRIDIKYPLGKSATESALKLLSSSHTKVEVYQDKPLFYIFGKGFLKKNRLTKTYYIAGPTSDNTGTIMKLEDDDKVYVTHIPGMNGYLSERFSTRLADWKSHEIFKYRIADISEVKVEFPETPYESYKIVNNGNRTFDLIKLMGNEKVSSYDTLRLLESLSAFNEINYELLLDDINKTKSDSIYSSLPNRVISLKLADGSERRLILHKRKNTGDILDLDGEPFEYDVDRLYGFIDNSKQAYSVQFFTADRISRPIGFLINEEGRNIMHNK